MTLMLIDLQPSKSRKRSRLARTKCETNIECVHAGFFTKQPAEQWSFLKHLKLLTDVMI